MWQAAVVVAGLKTGQPTKAEMAAGNGAVMVLTVLWEAARYLQVAAPLRTLERGIIIQGAAPAIPVVAEAGLAAIMVCAGSLEQVVPAI